MFNLSTPSYGPLSYGTHDITLQRFTRVNNDQGGYISIDFTVDSRPGASERKLTYFAASSYFFDTAMDAIVAQHPQFLGKPQQEILDSFPLKVKASYLSSVDDAGTKHNNWRILFDDITPAPTKANAKAAPPVRRKV